MRLTAAIFAAGALAAAALAPATAHAQLSETGGPVSYSADNLEYFDGERRLVLTGDVDRRCDGGDECHCDGDDGEQRHKQGNASHDNCDGRVLTMYSACRRGLGMRFYPYAGPHLGRSRHKKCETSVYA